MKLFGYWRSSCTWRVRIALAHKNVPHEYVPVHLVRSGGEQFTESYRALSPLAQVPALTWLDGGATRVLTQSLAIIEYLEERWPDPPLLPREPFARAKVRQLAEMVNAGIQPHQNTSVMKRVEALGADPKAWAAEWIARGLQALETATHETAGTYAVGDAVSIADACIVPQLYNARRWQVDLGAFPTLTRIEAASMRLPAFQAAQPDAQPDAEKT